MEVKVEEVEVEIEEQVKEEKVAVLWWCESLTV